MLLFQTMSCADSSLPSRMTLTSRLTRYMQLFQLQRLQTQRLQIRLFTLSCQNMDLIGPGTGRPHAKPHLITVMQALPINTATMFYNVSGCWWLTWPHTHIHASIHTYLCWHPCIYHVLQTPTSAGRLSLTKIRPSFNPRAFTCLKSLHCLLQPILTSGYNQPGIFSGCEFGCVCVCCISS